MTDLLLRRLADLEGADAALVLASGRAAIACTVLALLRPGDHVLSSAWLRASTRAFFQQELAALGVEVTFVNPSDVRGWRRDIRRTTRLLYVESPVLEHGRVVDLRPLRTLGQELGVALVVDATAASPAAFTPLTAGADVVVHDARERFFSVPDTEAGIVCGTEAVIDEVRAKMHTWGAIPHPSIGERLLHDLATLSLRVSHQAHVAHAVARALALAAPDRLQVHYPGLESHPDHQLAGDSLRHQGPVVMLTFRTSGEAALIADRLASQLDAQARPQGAQLRLAEASDTVRLHVGLEDASVLIADIADILHSSAT
ncbi:MAG: PLP-dependent transferase [Gemmatimonadaceae bacterium]|nr:PLP-dependent transferase [Gemmatimonadaceae bacterium]